MVLLNASWDGIEALIRSLYSFMASISESGKIYSLVKKSAILSKFVFTSVTPVFCLVVVLNIKL